MSCRVQWTGEAGAFFGLWPPEKFTVSVPLSDFDHEARADTEARCYPALSPAEI
jgi:hypothetical protein